MFNGFDDEPIIESVEAVNETTVRFNLTEPQRPFLRNIAMAPFRIASLKAIRENVEEFRQNPVGKGPFRFESWDQGQEVRLTKNEEWWGTDLPVEEGGGGPYVDRVVFRSIPDNTARVAALTGNQLSGADGLTPDDVPSVEGAGLQVITRPPLNASYTAMNMEKEPFDNPQVRQAVVPAINMQEILQAFFGDTADVASNVMPPTVPFFNDSLEPYAYDPEQSRQLLCEAGMPDGFETTLWYMPIRRPYMPDGKGIAQAIQRDLEEVGIRATLETREWGTYLEEIGRGRPRHVSRRLDGRQRRRRQLPERPAAEQDGHARGRPEPRLPQEPEFDDLLNRAASTIDENERRDLYFQVQEIVNRDAPVATIAYAKPPPGFQGMVQDYRPSPTGGEVFNTVELSQSGA